MIRRLGLPALVCLLLAGAALRDGFDQWVAATDLPSLRVDTSVEVHDRSGKLFRVFPVEDGRTRMALRLDDVDPGFLRMLIAYEDKRFYAHNGVDLRAALRAVGQAALNGGVVSGGSTLTMQVARLLENSGTGRWRGKLRQVRLALAMERVLTKEEILTLYLAHAPYGGAVEGVRAGALAWFGKEPARLTMAEAALLVALPQAPETRRPDRHPEAAKTARARVLERVNAPAQSRLAAVPRQMKPFARLAPHLTDLAHERDAGAKRIGLTLDAGLQAEMERLAARAVDGQDSRLSVAILVADHQSGEILASVGSPAYSAADGALGFVDMSRAVRSPGSTLKPFIYALAFDQGLVHPETLINDAPTAFGRYAPQNFDGQFRGSLTVREALQLSLNIPPVILLNELGPARLIAAMKRGGADPIVPGGKPGLAVALGGIGLTLTDLVQLYGGIANGGVVKPLIWNANASAQPSRRIMSDTAAWHLWDILSDLAPPAQTSGRNRQIAYKTGTSYGHRDAWSIGFDGRHVIGVWLGRPDGTPVPGAFGGEFAAPVLFEAFGRVDQKRTPGPLPPPDTLMVKTATLPPPLQQFRSRSAAFTRDANAPVVSFPPEGAVLQLGGSGIPLKLRAGTLPLTVLVNGDPVMTGVHDRDIWLPFADQGFSKISVIDARGRSASVDIRLQ
jgi:penicillin-binding protein 1C